MEKFEKIAELLVEAITERIDIKKEIFQKKKGMKERVKAIFIEG
jgi:3-hydroxyacyl-CoA dehydrogenase